MHIDEAMKCLRQAKQRGATHVVFAFWESDMFERHNDGRWANLCDRADEHFDWSGVHDELSDFFDEEV